MRDGIPSVGHFKKIRRMAFAFSEGTKRITRARLGASTTVNLLRDERHGRLLVRFRSADLKATRSIGIIGQARIVQGTATNITLQTQQLLKKLCTVNFAAPDIKNSGEISPDLELFHHIRCSVHALTVDSAGNEVAAGEAMMSEFSVTAHVGDDFMARTAWAPHMTTIIRDKAHGPRRVLARPWACDKCLSSVASAMILDPGSVAQLVQHSGDLRSWFAQASQNSRTRVLSSTFSNMRAAKHRFESLCTPLSRICLDFEVPFWTKNYTPTDKLCFNLEGLALTTNVYIMPNVNIHLPQMVGWLMDVCIRLLGGVVLVIQGLTWIVILH